MIRQADGQRQPQPTDRQPDQGFQGFWQGIVLFNKLRCVFLFFWFTCGLVFYCFRLYVMSVYFYLQFYFANSSLKYQLIHVLHKVLYQIVVGQRQPQSHAKKHSSPRQKFNVKLDYSMRTAFLYTICSALLSAKCLFPYKENKKKFTKNTTRRFFKEALEEIEKDPKVRTFFFTETPRLAV